MIREKSPQMCYSFVLLREDFNPAVSSRNHQETGGKTMTGELQKPPAPKPRQTFSGMQVLWMVLASMCLAVVATILAIKLYLFPSPFTPVKLSPAESRQLEAKLEKFADFADQANTKESEYTREGTLKPEPYSEAGASRTITFTEREVNAMVAKNTDLAKKMAIDLADNMVSVKLLIPLDPDFPMLGGKILRIHAGAELAFRNSRPVIKLKGVSIMGVPMPNAWLGGIKNIDLIQEFGADEGFWKSFADGVESISVVEDSLQIRLRK
jgi:hypothetical protein